MKNRIISLLIIVSLILVFIIFYKSLNKSSLYEPNNEIKKDIPTFSALTFFDDKEISSKSIFDKDNFYLLNIWASWCVPCRDEHPLLLSLSRNKKIKIIGLNYKDNSKNAEKFLKELGNPYKTILLDKDGTKSIEWGAFGVPETFLIYENKIFKKFIGPLNVESVKTIEKIIK